MGRTVTDAARATAAKGRPTDDAFLGGALQILQPRSGYRAGLDAVMLAAAVPTPEGPSPERPTLERPMRVLDLGAGVGTAGLCLARRIANAEVTLLEREPALVGLAKENVARNGLSARVCVVEGEVGLSASALRALGLAEESFHHVMANPPYHDRDAGTLAPDAQKAGAHAMADTELERWARFMARMTAPGGSVTVIHKAEALIRLLVALNGRFGGLVVMPLYPRQGAPAHRVIVQGIKGSRAPPKLLSGLVLHGAGDVFTPEAQEILRGPAALELLPKV
jgi:tRNA1(Val) A37 N6-methylase TrmN6